MTDGEPPATGAYAVDVRDGRVGRVMGRVGTYVQLRPPGGGKEWDCPPEDVRAAPTGEVLRARVREINAQGRLP
ncbi:hypothetical protein AR457_19480 [Streptomyces agglomeratus]|uniref:hypothetical protein n=1 Tax=Streptomyces agglomeratus TaxID=285458 RepID=UPI00085496BB|nr:hypothetical protein [Streptomyces agglomeratus]OEJ45986.1 hypothetical protein AR457_19480 [Streptomyces agglomeratus]